MGGGRSCGLGDLTRHVLTCSFEKKSVGGWLYA